MRQTNRRTLAGRTKAVNASINFNCFVLCTVQVSHPNLFVFLGHLHHLHQATVDYMTDKRHAERGLPICRPRRKRQQNNDARLLRSCDKYDSGEYTRMQFLRVVSHCVMHAEPLQTEVHDDSGQR